MARDPKRDLLGRNRNILLRDRDETLVRLETITRPRLFDRDHIPGLVPLQTTELSPRTLAGPVADMC